MTPEEQAAQSHQPGEGGAPAPTAEDFAGVEPRMSDHDAGRLRRIGAQLHTVAQANPDSPDGQRAAAMVQKIKQRLIEHYTASKAPTPEGGAGDVFTRNFADAATFGGSGLLADKLAKHSMPDADLSAVHEQQQVDDAASPTAAMGGQVAGNVIPYGGPSTFFKAAGMLTNGMRLARPAALGTRALVGALRGGTTTALALPAIGATRGAIAAPEGETLQGAGQGALDEVKGFGTSLPIGGLLGSAAEMAHGIRYGHGQTAEDIRTVEDTGKGKVAPFRGGARGGRYKEPILQELPGNSQDQIGEVSDRAGEQIRGMLNKDFAEAGQEYAAGKAEAKQSGGLNRNIDVYPLYKEALKRLGSWRLDNTAKSAIENEVVKPLSNVLDTGLSLEDANDFRGKLDSFTEFQPGKTDAESRAFGDLGEMARQQIGNTAMDDVNKQYAGRMDRLQLAHSKLGFSPDTSHTDMNNPAARTKVGNFVLRRGQTSGTAGLQTGRSNELRQLYPETGPLLDLPDLLEAKNRLNLTLSPRAGGMHYQLLGQLHHNIEPTHALMYGLGSKAERLNLLLQAVRRSMLSPEPDQPQQEEQP